MEDLRVKFNAMFSVLRVDLVEESYYLLEDSDSKCYFVPAWRVGLFNGERDPWISYTISGILFMALVANAGGEWLKKEGKWL